MRGSRWSGALHCSVTQMCVMAAVLTATVKNLSSPRAKKQSLPTHWPTTFPSKCAHPSQLLSLRPECEPRLCVCVYFHAFSCVRNNQFTCECTSFPLCVCLQGYTVFHSVFLCLTAWMWMWVCVWESVTVCSVLSQDDFVNLSSYRFSPGWVFCLKTGECAAHTNDVSHYRYILWLHGLRTFLQWRINKLMFFVDVFQI